MTESLWTFLSRPRFSVVGLVVITILASILRVEVLDHIHVGWH